MRLILTILLTTSFVLSQAQTPIKVTVSGELFNTNSDSISIAQFYGTHYVDFAKSKLSKKGTFEITTNLPSADYYVLKVGANHVNLILRNNSNIKVYGDASKIAEFSNIVGSDESANMNNFIKVLTVWNAKRDSAVRIMQTTPEKQEEINNSMQGAYSNFQRDLQAFASQNHNSAALMPVISVIDKENDFASFESIVSQLNAGFPESNSVKELMRQMTQIKAQKEAANLIAPGKVAPDFEEMKLDGKTTMKLSDLRGKIVLLDFWASWCGPCRKENPNVVRLYEKYKNDGFTVMSVSLDKDKNAWEAAIQKDNLTWPNHVSDLKQWQSKVGQLYQVKGIPFTALLDKEGKIIQTNLRGEALEQELKRQFGH